jgi:hypothetical protein
MNMKRFMNKKVAAIGLAAGLALGAAGIAAAYFTTDGSGTGTASVGSTPTGDNNLAVSVETGSATFNGTNTALLPTSLTDTNASIETIPYTVTNTTESDIHLSQEVITVSNTPGVAFPGTCEGSWFSVDGTSPTGTDTQTNTASLLPNSDGAPGDQYSGTLTIQLVDNSGNQNPCQGVTPTVTVSAS